MENEMEKRMSDITLHSGPSQKHKIHNHSSHRPRLSRKNQGETTERGPSEHHRIQLSLEHAHSDQAAKQAPEQVTRDDFPHSWFSIFHVPQKWHKCGANAIINRSKLCSARDLNFESTTGYFPKEIFLEFGGRGGFSPQL